jgi:hypothetical protein
MVQWSEFMSTNPEVQVRFPALPALRSASWVQLRSYMKKKSNGSGLERREYVLRGSVTLTTRHPLYAKVGNSPTSGGHSVGIVRSRNQATVFFFWRSRRRKWDRNSSSPQLNLLSLSSPSVSTSSLQAEVRGAASTRYLSSNKKLCMLVSKSTFYSNHSREEKFVHN